LDKNTIKSFFLIIIGIGLIVYSIYQSLESGYSFFPTSWGTFRGHKDIGGICYFALGAGSLAYGVFDPNATWNFGKKRRTGEAN
jgi:hypothetical protein